MKKEIIYFSWNSIPKLNPNPYGFEFDLNTGKWTCYKLSTLEVVDTGKFGVQEFRDSIQPLIEYEYDDEYDDEYTEYVISTYLEKIGA